MKIMKKSFPYRIKGALLSVLGAGVMGCVEKQSLTPTPMPEPEPEPIEQHDTYYRFGRNKFTQIQDLEQIKRSADSVEVRNIIFSAEYANLWENVPMEGVLETIIQPAFDAANGKGKGQGTLKHVNDSEKNHALEPRYNALGFLFEYCTPNER